MPELIESINNPFGGVVTKADSLYADPAGFRTQLERSMAAWQAERILVVWMEIPIANASLVPIAVDAGFSYHHAGEDYLLLTCALQEGSNIPPYASHYIGAGGIVLSESDDLLVVREKVGFGGRTPTLKLPGGALLAGEHLAEGVVREVLEETCVESEFEPLVCFRHWHGYRYGKSDILHTAQGVRHDHIPARSIGLDNAWIDRNRLSETVTSDLPATDYLFFSLAEMAAAVAVELTL